MRQEDKYILFFQTLKDVSEKKSMFYGMVEVYSSF